VTEQTYPTSDMQPGADKTRTMLNQHATALVTMDRERGLHDQRLTRAVPAAWPAELLGGLSRYYFFWSSKVRVASAISPRSQRTSSE